MVQSAYCSSYPCRPPYSSSGSGILVGPTHAAGTLSWTNKGRMGAGCKAYNGKYMFDTYIVKWYYINRSATDRRLALEFDSYKSNRQVVRLGRLFLCLIIAWRTYWVSKRKACNTQAKDRNKQLSCQHNTSPPFVKISASRFLCDQRSQSSIGRTNRLPSMVALKIL